MIHIGTCGFQYRDWYGPFYAPSLERRHALAEYARCFSALEIDVTYYRTPSLAQAQRMAETLAGSGIKLAVKLPGAATHRRQLTVEVLDPFFRFLTPLRDAGLLSALLAQFPESFRPTVFQYRYVRSLLETLPPDSVVVEFRGAEWDHHPLREDVRRLGASLAIVDQPSLPGLGQSGLPWVAGDRVQYLRFHGRNSAGWYAGSTEARYDYQYSPEELSPWVERLRRDATPGKTTLVFFNNHAHGAAPANAVMLAEALGQKPTRPRCIEEDDLFGELSN